MPHKPQTIVHSITTPLDLTRKEARAAYNAVKAKKLQALKVAVKIAKKAKQARDRGHKPPPVKLNPSPEEQHQHYLEELAILLRTNRTKRNHNRKV